MQVAAWTEDSKDQLIHFEVRLPRERIGNGMLIYVGPTRNKPDELIVRAAMPSDAVVFDAMRAEDC